MLICKVCHKEIITGTPFSVIYYVKGDQPILIFHSSCVEKYLKTHYGKKWYDRNEIDWIMAVFAEGHYWYDLFIKPHIFEE